MSELFDVFQLWDDFLVWTVIMVGVAGLLAATSGSMAVAALAAFMVFVVIATATGHGLLMNILTVAGVLVAVGFAFKLWNFEGLD